MFDRTLIPTLPAAVTLPADTTTAPTMRTGTSTVTMPYPRTTLRNGSGDQGSFIEPSRIVPGTEFLSHKDIREMTRASFPDGIPSSYTTLRSNGYNVPFVCANVRIFSDDEKESQEFEEWCLWDSGAEISHILCSKLDKLGIKGEGFVTAEVQIDGCPTVIDTTFVHKEQLPNSTKFIILGQRNLIANIEATTTPKSIEGPPLADDAGRYGSLTLL